jgi:hypothetical protein
MSNSGRTETRKRTDGVSVNLLHGFGRFKALGRMALEAV